MKKNILIILSIILLISTIFFFWKTKDQIDSNIKYINGLLYHLDIEMDIIEYTKKHYNDDKYLNDKLVHLIINKLLILSNLNPPISKLDGTPLNALKRLIDFNNNNPIDFRLVDSEYISQTIHQYLNSIEDEINLEIKKREKVFNDPLKKEIKEKWGIHDVKGS